MFEYLKGMLVQASPHYAVVDIHGIGYRVHTAVNTLGRLPSTGQEVIFYVSFLVKETSQILYGFLLKEERELFEILINVSGVGPKTALALLGHLDATCLVNSIHQNQIATLCKVPGIGKKTAERLILEVRDKLPEGFISPKITDRGSEEGFKIKDAVNALVHLGYSPASAHKAVKDVLSDGREEMDLSGLITRALRYCGSI